MKATNQEKIKITEVLLWFLSALVLLSLGATVSVLAYQQYFSEDATVSKPVQTVSYEELLSAPVDSIILIKEDSGKWISMAVVVGLETAAEPGVELAILNPNVPGLLYRTGEVVKTNTELANALWNFPARLVRVSDSDYRKVSCEHLMMTSHISKTRACPEEKQEELPQ